MGLHLDGTKGRGQQAVHKFLLHRRGDSLHHDTKRTYHLRNGLSISAEQSEKTFHAIRDVAVPVGLGGHVRLVEHHVHVCQETIQSVVPQQDLPVVSCVGFRWFQEVGEVV